MYYKWYGSLPVYCKCIVQKYNIFVQYTYLSLLLKNRSENMPPKTAPPTANEEISAILEKTNR